MSLVVVRDAGWCRVNASITILANCSLSRHMNYNWQVIRRAATEITGYQRINSFGGEIEIRLYSSY